MPSGTIRSISINLLLSRVYRVEGKLFPFRSSKRHEFMPCRQDSSFVNILKFWKRLICTNHFSFVRRWKDSENLFLEICFLLQMIKNGDFGRFWDIYNDEYLKWFLLYIIKISFISKNWYNLWKWRYIFANYYIIILSKIQIYLDYWKNAFVELYQALDIFYEKKCIQTRIYMKLCNVISIFLIFVIIQ